MNCMYCPTWKKSEKIWMSSCYDDITLVLPLIIAPQFWFMYKLYRHKLYREQIVSAQIVSAQFVSAQFVSDTNCIGHKLYRAQTVSGTNCIGHKLYLVTIFIQCSGSKSIYHSYQHMVLCVCVPRCMGNVGTKISVGENACTVQYTTVDY
jgi:hypothetical protein